MSALLPFEDAQRLLLDGVAALDCETVPIGQAAGRYLAQDLLARRSQPAADMSAMDGYAVCSEAIEGDAAAGWRIVGESASGAPYGGALAKGECVRISTGALMAEGGDAVLLQEDALRQDDRIVPKTADAASPRWIRRKGFDFAEGDRVLPRGTSLGPAQLALARMAGFTELELPRPARVAILDCGNELSNEATPPPGALPATNGLMVQAMVAGLPVKAGVIGPVGDNLHAMSDALQKARGADVVVTTGGASVGDHDIVRPALEAWGARMQFHRIAMKPGKPLMAGRRMTENGVQHVLGLPGNPASAFVTAFLFLLPLLRKLGGAERPLPRPVHLPLQGDVEAGGDRAEFLRAIADQSGVRALPQRDSSALRTLGLANALLLRPVGAAFASDGERLPVYLIGNGGIA